MSSTGEVGCIGDDFDEAFLKALISVGFKFPVKKVLLSTGPLVDKIAFIESARLLHGLGIEFYATRGTAEFLAEYDIASTTVYWPTDNQSPNAGEIIERRSVDLVINIPKNYQEVELTNDITSGGRQSISVFLFSPIYNGEPAAEALSRKKLTDLKIKELQAY